jgi:hypothetical protein
MAEVYANLGSIGMTLFKTTPIWDTPGRGVPPEDQVIRWSGDPLIENRRLETRETYANSGMTLGWVHITPLES